jgi:SAM-dependent methyltransferase
MTDDDARSKRLEAEIAAAMEAEPGILPWLPWLLQDLDSLSGATTDVLELLERAGLPQGARVLDLGCGRGEIAIALARRFRAHVLGIDAFAPFVEQARAAAEGLSCRFEHGDLREALRRPECFDAVLLIALGPVLGDPAATVGALRGVVVDGGLMVIDDAYLAGTPPSADWAGYPDRAATEAALTRHGDALLARAERTPAMQAFNQRALDLIRARVEALKAARPELEDMLERYLERQAFETDVLAGPVVPAVWVLRRAPRSPGAPA